MTWKQFLTEKVLGEEWLEPPPNHRDTCSCYECVDCRTYNRTFDNRNDLLDLYEAIYRDGKWEPLYEYLRNNYLMGKGTDECISSGLKAWLICLSGEGYEERCKMVAQFYGWNEQRDPVIDKNSGAY
ncbi:MAG: hypothetical protein WC343_06045 [Bacilli bacterium]|jgi:hypothetical protein